VKVARIRVPKLIIHSRRDEVVPFEMGERLFAAAAEPKHALWLESAGHNDAHLAEEAQLSAAIRTLLQRIN
jgi:fermentation-respiration switch protein FrsA (DUF1100 family)